MAGWLSISNRSPLSHRYLCCTATFVRFILYLSTRTVDGIAVYDPGDKATIVNGKWKPKARSQFRIDIKDIAAIYQEVREVDIRNYNDNEDRV